MVVLFAFVFLFLGVSLGQGVVLMGLTSVFLYFLFFPLWVESDMVSSVFDFVGYFLVMLSLILVLLMFVSVLGGLKNSKEFTIILGFSLMGVVLAFLASSLMGFYLYFEFIVMPMFFLIMMQGYNEERMVAAFYMIFYTLLFSLPFLLVLVMMEGGLKSSSFFYVKFVGEEMFAGFLWVFLLFVFLMKLPVYFFHLWLLSAHVEAPFIGSMLLAGVILKLGGYGLWRMFLFSRFSLVDKFYLMILSMVGSVLVSLMCLRQIDISLLVAYSSVVHMGPVFFSMANMSEVGFLGALMMMVSHGFCSSCLFFMLTSVYDHMKTRSMLMMRGLILITPVSSFFWFFFCIGNLGCPPFFNFFSEIWILWGMLMKEIMFILYFLFLLFLVGVYCVYMYMFLSHGHSSSYLLVNLSFLEIFVFFVHGLPVAFYILGMLESI